MSWGEVVITLLIGGLLGASLTVLVMVLAVSEFWKELLNK